MRKVLILLALLAFSCWVLTLGDAFAADVILTPDGKVLGQPFQNLQQQIDALKAEVDAIKTKGGIRVYDANNQFLGFFLGFDTVPNTAKSYVKIFVPALNHSVAIDIYSIPGHIVTDINPSLYESDDCKGPVAYLYDQILDIRAYSTADMTYHRYYLPTGTGILKTLTARSSWGPSGCVPLSPPVEIRDYHEAIEIPQKDIPFSLPVALPLRYEFYM